ncbi:MAG: heme-binding domain-containing protein, partial [Deltaproteobacteria bacterium]|nr:heme-binding domain-containing protein [Deltaproteobacteria bacterium]
MLLKKLAWASVLMISGFLLAAQLVPARRTNPPSHGALSAPPEVAVALKRACYDCHSNETHWPWYSGIAPFSWFIIHHVTLGRKEVNFSEWGSYYPATQHRKLEWIGRALHEEKMPPWSYRLMHPGARLSKADRVVLEYWIDSALAISPAKRS